MTRSTMIATERSTRLLISQAIRCDAALAILYARPARSVVQVAVSTHSAQKTIVVLVDKPAEKGCVVVAVHAFRQMALENIAARVVTRALEAPHAVAVVA